jgi:hypothetical protein
MSATERHALMADEIVALIDGENRADWLRFEPDDSFDERLYPWFEQALTQLVLAIGSEEVLFAQAIRNEEAASGQVVVLTSTLVFVAEVDKSEDFASRPRTAIVSRASLRRVTVMQGDKILWRPENVANRRSVLAWPGLVKIEIDYPGLPAPIVLSGYGISKFERDTPGAIVQLLGYLTHDLRTTQGG